MAKQKRKKAPAKPISEHQLFPAVVALWFSALFGLGSLAVRSSLLESLVRSSRIDLILPAAAPPLGVTARILMALILAAIGAGIGIAIARRLARPKLEPRERKRNARSSETGGFQPRYAQARTAEIRPEPVYGQSSGDEAAKGGLVQRRRALAIEHEEEDFVPHDMAPLPGGAPQILDIGSMGFAAEPVESAHEHAEYGQSPVLPAPAPAATAPLDWNRAPVQPQAASPRQEFQAPAFAPAPEVAQPQPVEQAHDDRQIFGQASLQPAETARPQIFGEAAKDDHVSQDFIRAAGYKTSIFETETAAPLFAPREAAVTPPPAATPAAWEAPSAPQPAAFAVPEFTAPEFVVPRVQASAPPIPVSFAPPVEAPVETAAAQPEPLGTIAAPTPAEPPLPSPAGLGMTDLATRLAESMARRRAARAGIQPPAAIPAPAPIEPAFAAHIAVPPDAEIQPVAPEPVAAPIPQAFAPVVAEEPAPIPQAFQSPFAEVPAQPATAPAAETPRLPTTAAQPFAPTTESVGAIPQAMRPLDLSGFEDDGDPLDSLLPPRHIAMPTALAAAVPPTEPPTEPVAELAAIRPTSQRVDGQPVDESDVPEAEVAEQAYASLTSLSARRSEFVRIEEAEPAEAAIEPVVIFPGQGAARPAEEQPASFRRFDAPSAAGHGQPVGPVSGAPEVDREEAERALRSALANLQRMSGAA